MGIILVNPRCHPEKLNLRKNNSNDNGRKAGYKTLSSRRRRDPKALYIQTG